MPFPAVRRLPDKKHQDTSMTTNIHFIGGEKGGVGKSLMSRVLAQYMIDHELTFLGFDTDRSHGALMRFYAGYASPVAIDKIESLDAIVEAAVDQPGRRILVDLAAQTLNEWVKRDEIDSGTRDGITTTELQRLKELERENKELRRANEILKLASAFFAQAELDRRLKS